MYIMIRVGIYLIMENFKIKSFLINGIKGLICIYIHIIVISSILYVLGIDIYFNTKELLGVDLLFIDIKKNTFNISVKPIMSLILFIISGIYLNTKTISKQKDK